MLIYAMCMYDVASVNEHSESHQMWMEMYWWTKFLVCFPLTIDIEPLPFSVLKNHHSQLRVVELFPERDADAGRKFMELAYKIKHDDVIVIMRDIFKGSNNTENKLQYLRTPDDLRKYLDLDQEYMTLTFPKDQHYTTVKKPLHYLLDNINKTDEKLTTITSNYEFLDSQPWYKAEYIKLLKLVGIDFNEVIAPSKKYKSHTFLWWGYHYRTRLHAAAAVDFFLEIAGRKRWRFWHKRYLPYSGMFRALSHGSLKTAEYWIEDYPKGAFPFTEVVLNPGDYMYFSYWHMHEVTNIDEGIMGLALGIRKGDPVRRLLAEPVKALALYTFLCLPGQIHHAMIGSSFDDPKDDQCESYAGRKLSFAYNGSYVTRYDLKMINGSCVFAERELDFQTKEMNGVYDKEDWKPRHSRFLE